MKIGTQTINGVKFEIEVLPATGMFRTEWDGDTVESTTKAALIARLTQMTRDSVRVAISAVLIDGGELIPITLTGFHQSNGNLLYKLPNRKGIQQMYKYWSTEKMLRVLTAAEQADYKALIKAQRDAQKALDRWLKAHRIDGAETVRKALAKTEAPKP